MFYIGIDVSKAKLDCSLLTDATNNKRKAKVVINSTTGIADFISLDKQAARYQRPITRYFRRHWRIS
jgi:hypothetical protein